VVGIEFLWERGMAEIPVNPDLSEIGTLIRLSLCSDSVGSNSSVIIFGPEQSKLEGFYQ